MVTTLVLFLFSSSISRCYFSYIHVGHHSNSISAMRPCVSDWHNLFFTRHLLVSFYCSEKCTKKFYICEFNDDLNFLIYIEYYMCENFLIYFFSLCLVYRKQWLLLSIHSKTSLLIVLKHILTLRYQFIIDKHCKHIYGCVCVCIHRH